MLAWFLKTGFGYLLGVATVAVIGLLLVYWGLWGDRSKGRARCPRCWYDMRGTLPKLECPECGHDARQAHRLRKHHRQWGPAVLGVLLVLLSAYPLVIVAGWWREQAVLRRYQIAGIVQIETLGPAWLIERLPHELTRFFQRVTYMRVSNPSKLFACRSLPHLRGLALLGDQVNDPVLVHLKRLSKLESLELSYTRVTDAGLVHLKRLSNLKHLNLLHTPVSATGLVGLQGMQGLTSLSLWGTRVTDASVARVKQALPNVTIQRPTWNSDPEPSIDH
jgi:hypothetical protein